MDKISEQDFFDKMNADRIAQKKPTLTWNEFQKVMTSMENDGEIKRMAEEN